METLIIILSLIAGATGCLMLFSMNYVKKNPTIKSILHLFFALALVEGGFFMFGSQIEKEKKKSFLNSEYNFKTEIQQEFLNGQEISRDTIYIFTPKKKN